nr:malectin domain-containing carbohydrate-binding protein [Spirochaetales bacterium]
MKYCRKSGVGAPMFQRAISLLAVGFSLSALAADPGKIVVQVDQPGAEIDPMFYGIMTEEINYSYEGGLYGELIQNRIFKNTGSGARAIKVTGTNDPILFMSEHYGMDSFSCKAPNGKYVANLYFSETYDGVTGPGQRVFSFNIQGKEFKDFDIWKKSGGFCRAYVESVPVEVKDGTFSISFSAQVENPAINAIELIPDAQGAAAIRINAGRDGDAVTDSSNHVWQPDSGFTGGGGTIDRGPVVDEDGMGTINSAPHWFLLTSLGSKGQAELDATDPVNDVALTTSMKLSIEGIAGNGRVGIANDGYWGIPVKPNWTYTCSFYAKGSAGFSGPLTVSIESS